MDKLPNLLWWTMAIDGLISQYIAVDNGYIDGHPAQSLCPGNRHRRTLFTLCCGGQHLSIDRINSLLSPTTFTDIDTFHNLPSLAMRIDGFPRSPIAADNVLKIDFPSCLLSKQ